MERCVHQIDALCLTAVYWVHDDISIGMRSFCAELTVSKLKIIFMIVQSLWSKLWQKDC